MHTRAGGRAGGKVRAQHATALDPGLAVAEGCGGDVADGPVPEGAPTVRHEGGGGVRVCREGKER